MLTCVYKAELRRQSDSFADLEAKLVESEQSYAALVADSERKYAKLLSDRQRLTDEVKVAVFVLQNNLLLSVFCVREGNEGEGKETDTIFKRCVGMISV
jgi:hypothetical protein